MCTPVHETCESSNVAVNYREVLPRSYIIKAIQALKLCKVDIFGAVIQYLMY
jgi:hypothetical protein